MKQREGEERENAAQKIDQDAGAEEKARRERLEVTADVKAGGTTKRSFDHIGN